MDIVNRIYFKSSKKSDFNIKPPDNDNIKEIKKILFRWFPKGAKLKYNYYKNIYECFYFIILYKKRLYFYDLVRKSKWDIKLKTFYIINTKKNQFKHISYSFNRIKLSIYKNRKIPINIYSKNKYNLDNLPYLYFYKIDKLDKNIYNDSNYGKIYETSYYNLKISFHYKYIYNNIFSIKSTEKSLNLIFNGQFRCFLLFI